MRAVTVQIGLTASSFFTRRCTIAGPAPARRRGSRGQPAHLVLDLDRLAVLVAVERVDLDLLGPGIVVVGREDG